MIYRINIKYMNTDYTPVCTGERPVSGIIALLIQTKPWFCVLMPPHV